MQRYHSIKSLVWFIGISLVFGTAVGCGDSGRTRYTTAPSGLVLRGEPSPSGGRIALIRYASPLTVLEEKPEETTIGDTTGRWTRVRHEKQEGWVFGAYLSDSQPVQRCFVLASATTDSEATLFLDGENVHGSLQGTIHDEEQGYFTSYESAVQGKKQGETLVLNTVTKIEYDVQKGTETWILKEDSLATHQGTLKEIPCKK